MPIIIDPTKPGPPDPGDEATSSDGLLTATRFVEVSRDWNGSVCKRRSRIEGDFCTPAGVYLVANFESLAGPLIPGRDEQVLATNFYPDPSQEFGIAPMALTPDAGSGVLALDASRRHTGAQAIRFTNNATQTLTNLAIRPNPTATAGGWTAVGANTATRVNDVVRRPGTWAVRCAPTAAGGGFIGSLSLLGITANNVAGAAPVTAGQTYTISVWWQANIANCAVFWRANFFDAANVQVGTVMTGPTQPTTNPANTWARNSWTFTVPAGATNVRPLVQINLPTAGSGQLTDLCWITDCQIEAGAAATSYFDGDMTSDANNTYAWTGTPQASPSTRFTTIGAPSTVYRTSANLPTAGSMGLAAGDPITLSVWMFIPSTATPYSTAIRFIGTGVTGATPAPPTQRDQWVQVICSGVVADPAGNIQARIYGPALSPDAIWYDDFTLNPGSTPQDFNGNTTTGTGPDLQYRWRGTPGASASDKFIPAIATIYPDQTKWPDYVRFMRLGQPSTNPDLPGIPDQPVRGADPAIAVGGIARAYDLEAPANRPSQWVAIPIFRDGTEGPPTAPVAMTPAFPDGNLDCWIKPTGAPLLTTLVQIVDPFPEFLRVARNYLNTIQGSPYPAGGWDLRLGFTATFTFWTPDWVERERVLAALSAGPIFVQCNPDYLIEDFYALPGDLTESYLPTTMTDPGRLWSVPITVIDRPDTADTSMMLPCRSYADVHDIVQTAVGTNSTYTDRQTIFPTYADAGRPEGASLPAAEIWTGVPA